MNLTEEQKKEDMPPERGGKAQLSAEQIADLDEMAKKFKRTLGDTKGGK